METRLPFLSWKAESGDLPLKRRIREALSEEPITVEEAEVPRLGPHVAPIRSHEFQPDEIGSIGR